MRRANPRCEEALNRSWYRKTTSLRDGIFLMKLYIVYSLTGPVENLLIRWWSYCHYL